MRIGGQWHRPVGVRGWTHVVLRRERDGARRVRSLDDMLLHLEVWDRSSERRVGQRRQRVVPPEDVPRESVGEDRREEDRRVAAEQAGQRRSTDGERKASSMPLSVEPEITGARDAGPAASPPRDPRTESPLVIVARV